MTSDKLPIQWCRCMCIVSVISDSLLLQYDIKLNLALCDDLVMITILAPLFYRV